MSLAPANFSERLVPRSAKAASQAPDRGAEAENASAAFRHYTEEFRVGAREKMVRPAANPSNPTAGRTIALSDHAMILLRAVASYEQCSNEDAVVQALADYVRKIGAGPLARAVLDESERLAAAAIGAPVDDIPDDLGDLPDFERSEVVRFSEARKAPRDVSGGLRR